MVAVILISSWLLSCASAELRMADYLPNEPIARTHVLVTADGFTHGVDFPTAHSKEGIWGKWLTGPGMDRCDPRVVTDWLVWALPPVDLVGLGFDFGCAREHVWFIPPGSPALPTTWNQEPWSRTVQGVNVHVVNDAGISRFVSQQHLTATVTLAMETVNGESLIRWRAVAHDDAGVLLLDDSTYFSACIPLEGEGCSPGIRRIISHDSQGQAWIELWFTGWRKRGTP